MPFTLREHTADVAVEATGTDLGDTFAAVADGLAAAQCDAVPEGGERFDVNVRAESREALLFDYCDDLVYQRDVRGVLPVANRAAVREEPGADDGDATAWVLEGSARGVPLDDVAAREVKAVTYSQMELEETDVGWRAYVVFDV